MKSVQLFILGLTASTINAFVPQHFAISKSALVNQPVNMPPSIIVLEASAARDKKAARSKWAESRGYFSSSANESSVEVRTGKAPKLIIAGAPASGKGTQCELIKEKYGVVHLSTGDMLRAAVAAGTEVGKQAKDFMDAGKLVPDEVIIGVVKDRLEEQDCIECGWLLDGFPRTPAQAEALASAGVTADCFIFLNVPDEVLVERVVGRRTDPETGKIYHMTFSPPEDEAVLARLEQRSDDTEEKVKVRLEQFHANVEAVKGSYTDIAVEVDGTSKPEDVSQTIMMAIDSVLEPSV
jgi:adenylate kinase